MYCIVGPVSITLAGRPCLPLLDHVTCKQLYGVSSDILVRLTSGLSEQYVKKQCGLTGSCFGGRMALDLGLSQIRKGVAAMGQD